MCSKKKKFQKIFEFTHTFWEIEHLHNHTNNSFLSILINFIRFQYTSIFGFVFVSRIQSNLQTPKKQKLVMVWIYSENRTYGVHVYIQLVSNTCAYKQLCFFSFFKEKKNLLVAFNVCARVCVGNHVIFFLLASNESNICVI